jgi:CHAD domain-containing protein
MKKNLLNHYVVNLLKSIEQNLSIYIEDKQPEYLHNLRVDIKKIKAAFSFSENVYNEKYNTAKLKSLFNKAGKIREIQINIHLLGLFPHPPEMLIEQLRKKENILTQQFIKCGSRYGRLIKEFRKNVCLPEILPNKKTINKYFKKEKQKANKKLKNKDREDLHRYRAKIKKLMYVYNVLPKRIQKEIELNETEINRQQQKLGDWHDTYSTINFLSHEFFPIKTAENVVKLKEQEKRQFNALLRNLTNNPI